MPPLQDRPQERVLVTGAAGFIGSHLVDRLLARGDVVIGVDNFDPFYSPAEKRRNLAAALADPRFRLVEADCADGAGLDAALDDDAGPDLPGDAASDGRSIDVVVHLAAKAGVRPSIEAPEAYVRANVVATQAMLELARRRGIRRFVFGSSSSVYGNNRKVPFSEDDPVDHPISPYAATKRACELIAHTYHHLFGMGVLSLRFFTVYGPRQRPDLAIRKFATLMLRGEPVPMFGPGTTERDYTWIDDILDGVVAAVDRTRAVPGEHRIINLGESRTTSLRRLIELLGDALGVEPVMEPQPMQPGDVDRTYADVSVARELLGYRPRVPVEDGIPRFVEWIRDELQRAEADTAAAGW